MPELPEVETIKNELMPHIIGRTVTNVTLCWEGIVRQPTVTEFRSRLIGREITGVTRRGKYLLVSLNSHEWLIIHLKMSGALLVRPDSSEPPRFTRAIIHLDNSTRVFFRDPRKFGLMRLVREVASIVGKLGPEPLEPGFTSPLLSQRLNKRSAPLKALLCDQKVIAGIGNMYADETLFLASQQPLTDFIGRRLNCFSRRQFVDVTTHTGGCCTRQCRGLALLLGFGIRRPRSTNSGKPHTLR